MSQSKSFISELASISQEVLESLPSTVNVDVEEPCTGSQSLTKQSDTLYAGSTGDFTYATLYSISVGDNQSWELKTWDYRQGSGCYGITYFRRNPADSDPIGDYCLYDGSIHCDEGNATIS